MKKKASSKFKQILFVLFVIGCLVNLALSIHITIQKNHNDGVAREKCFAGDGGCYTVQTSVYAKTFGIVNPYYGFFFFSLGAILFGLLGFNSYKPIIPKLYYKELKDIIQFFLLIGATFSVWLLYVQFSILGTTCKYCLWVDGIMIAMAIIFSIYKRKL